MSLVGIPTDIEDIDIYEVVLESVEENGPIIRNEILPDLGIDTERFERLFIKKCIFEDDESEADFMENLCWSLSFVDHQETADKYGLSEEALRCVVEIYLMEIFINEIIEREG